jgi:uncharacterized membrane protein
MSPISLYAVALAAHIAAGALALLLFWTVGALRKGTALHRRLGQGYLIAMLAVIATGVPLAHALLARGTPAGALFLGYLLLLVGTACWSAWRAIRDRGDRRRYFGPIYWIFAITVFGYGAGLVVLGLRDGHPLFAVFGAIGVLAGIGAVHGWRRSSSDPKWWLKEHYGAMIGNGVATHIAFFGVGLRNALPGIDPQLLQSFAWFGPLAGALVAGWWLQRRYGGDRRRAALSRVVGGPQPSG